MKQWTEYGKAQVEVNGIEYVADIRGSFSHFKDGEDADGNRGWWVTECDDFNVETITPTPPDDDIEAVENAFYDLEVDEINWEGPGEPDED